MTVARPLEIVLVGYGKMGRALEQAAIARGHRVHRRIDPAAPERAEARIGAAAFQGVDIALEFTNGRNAPANVRQILDLGVPVVSGSTGWNEGLEAARAQARDANVGFLWSPNFSLGVQVLFRLTDVAAQWLGALGFAPYLTEAHHQAKQDAPSGTAKRLAEILVARTPGKERYGVAPADVAVPADLVPVAWVRAGAIPGNHTLGWDGPGETIEIAHVARDRAVFAEGALRAAEWLVDHPGPQTIDDMLDSMVGAH